VHFRYPDQSIPRYSCDILVTEDRAEVKDLVLSVGIQRWSTDDFVADLQRSSNHSVIAFDLPRTKVYRSCQCIIKSCHCSYNMSVEVKMEQLNQWRFLIIGEDMQMVNISLILGNISDVGVAAKLRWPMLDLDGNYTLHYSIPQGIWRDKMNTSLLLVNPISGKKIPAIDAKHSIDFRVNKIRNHVVGNMSATYLIWNPCNPTKPITLKSLLMVRENEERTARIIDVDLGDSTWLLRGNMTVSHNCWCTITIGQSEVCIPDRFENTLVVETPVCKCNSTRRLSRHVLRSNTTCMMVGNEVKRPWFIYNETFDYTWNELFLGNGIFDFNVSWPVPFRFVATQVFERNAASQEQSDATTNMTWKFPYSPVVQLLLTPAPTADQPRHLTLTAGDRTFMSSAVETSRVSSQYPYIPTRVHLSDVEVDIPVSAILRRIPVLKVIKREYYDWIKIKLDPSSVIWTLDCRPSDVFNCTMTTIMTLSSPLFDNDLLINSNMSFSPTLLSADMTMNLWNAHMRWSFNPKTFGWIYESRMTSPWLV